MDRFKVSTGSHRNASNLDVFPPYHVDTLVKDGVRGSGTAEALPVQLQAVEVNQGEGGVLLIGPGVLEAEQQLGEAGLQTELGAEAGLDVVEEVRRLAAAGQGAEAKQPAGGLQQLHNIPGLQEVHHHVSCRSESSNIS